MKRTVCGAIFLFSAGLAQGADSTDLENRVCGDTKTFPIASKVCLAESVDSGEEYIGYCKGLFMTGNEPECALKYYKVTGTQQTENSDIYQANLDEKIVGHKRLILRISKNFDSASEAYAASFRINNAFAYGGQMLYMKKVKRD